MRHQGKLTNWNDDRGFGFVSPNGGGDPVFLHISGFSRPRRRPAVGDLVTYELVAGERGKTKATAVAFVGPPRQAVQSSRGPGRVGVAAVTVAVCAAGYVGYHRWNTSTRSALEQAHRAPPARSAPDQRNEFQCSGKTSCSQMTSCEEARFYLANCPDTHMDGDGDGIPCEQQWCE
jgi:cold shock CspA family protein